MSKYITGQNIFVDVVSHYNYESFNYWIWLFWSKISSNNKKKYPKVEVRVFSIEKNKDFFLSNKLK